MEEVSQMTVGYAKLQLIKHYARKGKQEACFRETTLSAELAEALGCRTEVKVPYGMGFVDVLSKDWLLECKKEGTHAEKAAIGQLLVYKFCLNYKGNIGIGIIGTSGRPKPGTILFCRKFNIHIFYYNLNTRQWEFKE